MRSILVITLLGLASCLGGCASISGVDEVSAEVKSVSVVEQTAQGARIEVIVLVRNPNVTPLPMPHCSCTVTIEGLGSFSFDDIPNRTATGKRTDIIQDTGLQTFSFFAAFPTNGKDVGSLPYSVTGSVSYTPPGEIRKLMTDAYIPLPWANFSASGKL